MSDFTYDNQDFTAIRVATIDLQKANTQATYLGLLSVGTLAGFEYLTRNSGSRWQKPGFLGATLGATYVFTYLFWTWGARQRLDTAAAHINTKYSNIISRTLNFEK